MKSKLYHNKLIVHKEKGINLPKKSLHRLWMTQNIINVSVIQNFKFYNDKNIFDHFTRCSTCQLPHHFTDTRLKDLFRSTVAPNSIW